MGGIKLLVLSEQGQWRIRVGEKLSRPFKSHGEAVRMAFDRALSLSKNGIESEVVMKVMTCQFGPNGFEKTIPTPRPPLEGG
jgi:hypothetical protein